MQDLLQESGVFALGIVKQILNGKDFDRGLYAMKLINEVLHAQFLKQFENWTLKQGEIIPEWFVDVLQKLQTKYQDSPNDAVKIGKIMDELKVVVDESLEPMIADFREHGRELSATFRFWDDYLQKVSIPLKVFINGDCMGCVPVC